MDNHIHVKLISLEDIYKTKCFDLKQIIQIIEDALLAYSNNEILLPDKISQIFNEGLQTRINCMPSTLLKEGVELNGFLCFQIIQNYIINKM